MFDTGKSIFIFKFKFLIGCSFNSIIPWETILNFEKNNEF